MGAVTKAAEAAVKKALFSFGFKETHKPRKPEWSCTTCQVLNFMDWECCRYCQAAKPTLRVHQREPKGKGKGYGKLGRGPRLLEGSAWERPLAKATALEQMAATARRVGA